MFAPNPRNFIVSFADTSEIASPFVHLCKNAISVFLKMTVVAEDKEKDDESEGVVLAGDNQTLNTVNYTQYQTFNTELEAPSAPPSEEQVTVSSPKIVYKNEPVYKNLPRGADLSDEDRYQVLRALAAALTEEEKKDLYEMSNYAKVFKEQRISLGFTQQDVCSALHRIYDVCISQTTVSRFESAALSFKNMYKLRANLQKLMEDIEKTRASGASLGDILNDPNLIKSVYFSLFNQTFDYIQAVVSVVLGHSVSRRYAFIYFYG
ncbi:unnamed protein product [Gongylonema pulchrum]|uniref:POU-specific domain-containing protein n=1 Tax=Gongylonema pulchrum TaxID=637853 RepID=A0A183CVF2_9BILA|nr:unnamed protein product [Gongylonema pulchrum]